MGFSILRKVIFSFSLIGFMTPTFALGSSSIIKQKDQIIYNTYKKSMMDQFVKLSNLSKSSKDQREFLQNLVLGIDDPKLQKNLDEFSSLKVPLILLIPNGIEFKFQGKKTVVSLSSQIDALIVNGKRMPLFSQNMNPDYSLGYLVSKLDFFESPAEAQVIDIIKAAVEILEGAKGFDAKVIAWAIIHGATTLGGTIAGCRLGTRLDSLFGNGTDILSSCGKGAVLGAFFGALSPSYAVALSKMDANFAAKILVGLGAPTALGATTLLVVDHAHRESFAHGSHLICGKGGDFRFESIDDSSVGYSFGDCSNTSTHVCFQNPTNDLGIFHNLVGKDTMTDMEKPSAIKSVRDELTKFMKICIDRGPDYEENFPAKSDDSIKRIDPSKSVP